METVIKITQDDIREMVRDMGLDETKIYGLCWALANNRELNTYVRGLVELHVKHWLKPKNIPPKIDESVVC